MSDQLIELLAYLAIGATFFSALILTFAHLLGPVYRHLPRARLLGAGLLLNLCLLQFLHLGALSGNSVDLLWDSRLYVTCIFLTGPLFFFFCRAVLYPDQSDARWATAAALPPLLGAAFPGEIMFFVAFVFGSCYFGLLTFQLVSLRSQRRRFAAELAALATLFVLAGMTLLLGVLMPLLSHELYVGVFAILNGLSFVPAMALVVRYPDLISRAEEAVQMARATTTLAAVDVDGKLDLLERLMTEDRLYRDDTLNLAALAEQLALSSHQTSELLNQHQGIGFSRYLRQRRVAEACRLLTGKPDASVLSIGLSVGFSSQSTFYTAFKDEHGVSPGQYRRGHAASPGPRAARV